jgi:hypothetical protein
MKGTEAKTKAVIQPIPTKSRTNKVSADPAFGMWKDRKDLGDVEGYVRKLRKSRTAKPNARFP